MKINCDTFYRHGNVQYMVHMWLMASLFCANKKINKPEKYNELLYICGKGKISGKLFRLLFRLSALKS